MQRPAAEQRQHIGQAPVARVGLGGYLAGMPPSRRVPIAGRAGEGELDGAGVSAVLHALAGDCGQHFVAVRADAEGDAGRVGDGVAGGWRYLEMPGERVGLGDDGDGRAWRDGLWRRGRNGLLGDRRRGGRLAACRHSQQEGDAESGLGRLWQAPGRRHVAFLGVWWA
jgi:hypothetical protein